jgi:hypothetical protein
MTGIGDVMKLSSKGMLSRGRAWRANSGFSLPILRSFIQARASAKVGTRRTGLRTGAMCKLRATAVAEGQWIFSEILHDPKI